MFKAGKNTKIKLFSMCLKDREAIEAEVNEFCNGRVVENIKMTAEKILVIYKGE